MATLKTPSPTQLPWEGFWLSYRKYFNQFCEDGASLPDTEDVPIRIIANEAPGRIEFHRYKIEDIVIHQADVVDRIVVVELTPVLNGCQMRIQAFNIYRLLPSSILSWPFYIFVGTVTSPFRFFFS